MTCGRRGRRHHEEGGARSPPPPASARVDEPRGDDRQGDDGGRAGSPCRTSARSSRPSPTRRSSLSPRRPGPLPATSRVASRGRRAAFQILPKNSCTMKRPIRVPVSIVVQDEEGLEHDREVIPILDQPSILGIARERSGPSRRPGLPAPPGLPWSDSCRSFPWRRARSTSRHRGRRGPPPLAFNCCAAWGRFGEGRS